MSEQAELVPVADQGEVAVQGEGAALDLSRPEGLMAALLQASPNADTAKLDALAAIYERMQDSAAKQAYSRAMAMMQPKLPAVVKGGHNTHLKSTYSRLEDIQQAIRPLLSEHGFAYSWTSETRDGQIWVTCIVRHQEGHSESDTIPLPIVEQKGTNALQQRGIAMSYGKRYTLCNILGIQLGGEDNDGQTNLSGDTLTGHQVKAIRDKLETLGRGEDMFLQWAGQNGLGATELEAIAIENFDRLVGQLDHWLKVSEASNG